MLIKVAYATVNTPQNITVFRGNETIISLFPECLLKNYYVLHSRIVRQI